MNNDLMFSSKSENWATPQYLFDALDKEFNFKLDAAADKYNHKCVVMLLPARTDTSWFHDYILYKAEIRFIRGRIKFGNAKNSAPFPSMIVIYRGGNKNGKNSTSNL